MLCALTQVISSSNAFNAMYVNTVNTFSAQYTHMLCMLMQLTQSNYNVDPNTKSLNYMKI